MYTLNGKHPDLSVIQQYLDNGDEIVFHYTDNYPVQLHLHQLHKWSSESMSPDFRLPVYDALRLHHCYALRRLTE